ncbi:hypothetical protein AX769_18695 [Frondihabitans sp. PAMC 28766]|nr:hypothetical protein AX769_18695 [Frondihabitans sp. PAMC 28766]
MQLAQGVALCLLLALRAMLLEGDRRAGGLESSLGLLGGLLVGALENGRGGAVDDGLGLAETEARERADLFDDLDLLVTGGLEDDVERVLLLDLFDRGGGAGGTGGGDGAAAVTSKTSSNFLTKSESSMSVSSLKASISSSWLSFAMIFSLLCS